MSISPITNANIQVVQNHIKSQDPSAIPSISQEALEKLEAAVRERRFDSFEPGEGYGIRQLEELDYNPFSKPELSTVFTSSQVSGKAQELSLLMDEQDMAVDSKLGWTLDIDQAYRDRMVQHFGEIGRQIDEAFTAGEITRQEYDDLNAGLNKYTETITSRTERRSALMAVLRKTSKMQDKLMAWGASQEEIEAFNKWHRETLQDRIQEYIRTSCAIDRDLLAKLIQQVREGKDLVQPEDRLSSLEEKNLAGIFESGPAPLAPEESE